MSKENETVSRPWTIVAKFSSFEEADQKRNEMLKTHAEAKVRKLEAELQLEREKNIMKMNMERPDG